MCQSNSVVKFNSHSSGSVGSYGSSLSSVSLRSLVEEELVCLLLMMM